MSMSAKSNSFQMHLKKARRKRYMLLFLALFVMAAAVGLVVFALGDTASYFRMPSEITEEDIASQRPLRLGGFVEKGSVVRGEGTEVSFNVTDFGKVEYVKFNGILPDLFREDQGVIVEGNFNGDKVFIASRVLAKHDEKYVPKDVADRLKAQGLWEEYQKHDK
ncbi:MULTISPECIES: cytochrome c maturation protein CcmE [unclassified Bartonella]|uniref:cytochrome c maturation protein CcmE n=1 Tax=unclassified Bartonella TaxID=2645622 RepID=UPI0015FC134B|nr:MULTISPECIES: cytochrome c maturation protein CcmE [unclassified Bartonella]UXN04692.1 cytochrome c maturation protein CcmE [Bartonella sp. HY406]UXN07731.1 cytochrome c maturation protein CcmE [Bartonella sp. HY761]